MLKEIHVSATYNVPNCTCAGLRFGSEFGTVSFNLVPIWSPVWEIRGKGDWTHHLVHSQCHPRVQIPPHCEIRLLGAIREHRIYIIPLGQSPSIGVLPGHGSIPVMGVKAGGTSPFQSSSSRGTCMLLVSSCLGSVFRIAASSLSLIFLVLQEKSLHFTISWLQSKPECSLS